MSQLVTGEAVVLDLRLAKFPSRAIAFGIDLIVLSIVGVPLFIGLAWALDGSDPALQAALSLTVLVALLVGVPVTVETLARGKSLGKVVMGLRVVRDDGGPIRFRHALARGLAGFFVDFYLTSGAGAVICSLLNSKGKRVGDILAGTVVVRESTPDTTGPMSQMPPQLAAWAAGLELSRLPANLALAARNYLARMPQLAPDVRESMGEQIATSVAAHVSPPAPAGTPAWAYLAAVLSERRRREEARWAGVANDNGRRTTPSGLVPAPPRAVDQQTSQPQASPPQPSGARAGEARSRGGFAPPD